MVKISALAVVAIADISQAQSNSLCGKVMNASTAIASDTMFLESDQEATKRYRLGSAFLSKLTYVKMEFSYSEDGEYHVKFNKLDSLSLLSPPKPVAVGTLYGHFEQDHVGHGPILIGRLTGFDGNVATFEASSSLVCDIDCKWTVKFLKEDCDTPEPYAVSVT